MTHVMALTPGTELVGDFQIDRVLGVGGFGITYLAKEIALDRSVTIKEYFPSDFAARGSGQSAVPRSSDCTSDYRWGLDRFIEEAQTLARFDHRNICRVYRYFKANNTAYMVLQFEQGSSLKTWIKNLGRAPRQAELDKLVAPLLDALELIHKADFLHRDIAPDNIMVREDGTPVLIDFGSARGEIARHSRTVSALVKPGYSPYEQYAEKGAQQGPWTDIYAFAATLYHVITGKRPPDSPSRVVKDEYVPAKNAALASYRSRFLAAIDRALELDIKKRPQSVVEWRGDLLAPDQKPAKKPATARASATAKPKAQPAAASPAIEPALPPPPDAPGPKGGILDFVEGLRKKAAPAVAEKLAAPPPPPAVTAKPIDPAKPAKVASPPGRGQPTPPPPPTKVETPPSLPRPRRLHARPRTFWRHATAALLLVAGLASAAIGLKDRLSFADIRKTVTTTSSTRKAEPEAAGVEFRAYSGAAVGLGFIGDQLISAGADGVIKVWSAATGSLLRTVTGVGPTVTSFASVGRRMLTGHVDGHATLWDLDRSEPIATFKRNEAAVWAVAFAGSTDRVALGSHDWTVTVWDAGQPRAPLHVLEAHESAVQAVAFSAAKGLIGSGGADHMLRLWSLETGAEIRSYRGHKDFVTAVDFSADGRLVASADLDGGIRVWSTSSTRLVATLRGHRGRVNAIAFAPSGDILATAGDDGVLRVWDARRSRLLRAYAPSADPIVSLKSVAFSADGRRLAAGGESGIVRIRDVQIVNQTARAGRD